MIKISQRERDKERERERESFTEKRKNLKKENEIKTYKIVK